MTRNEAVIVSIDERDGKAILVVGRQKNGQMQVINAFENEEAIELYEKLITQKVVKK